MACSADRYTRPPRRASRGREGSASYAFPFNPPVEPEEYLLTHLIVVFGSVNTQGPFIAMLAEFERNLISERTKAGLEAARARGRTGGRPPTLATSKKVQLARQLFADKTNTIKDICKTLTISKSTFYRYVGMQTRSEKEQAAVDQ